MSDDEIATIRRRFEPRRLIAWARWGVAAPDWTSTDPLRVTYDHQERLFREGRVVWGCFVQANACLYEDAARCMRPHPAMVLYGLDPALDAAAAELERVARGLYRYKDTTPADPDERAFAAVITDETGRAFDHPLPRALGAGFDLATTTTMVHREHLPAARLLAKLFPLLVDPRTHASLVLPSEYWTAHLLRAWGVDVPPGEPP